MNNQSLSNLNAHFYEPFESLIKSEYTRNAWFTEEQIRKSLHAIAKSLSEASVNQWMRMYPALPVEKACEKTVGVVMAGNIPLVGFHDMISVLMSGNKFLGKMSAKDDRLINMLADILCFIHPDFKKKLNFTQAYLKNVDAVIATGSNNTSRYFDYYFKDIPSIIRKNRNGIALLTGNESDVDLKNIGDDIFSYFGLGCRNVTKVFIPQEYNLEIFLQVLESFKNYSNHNKYMNNIDYHRSVYLMNKVSYLDNGVILFKEDINMASPVGVVYYEKYSQIELVKEKILQQKDLIQCVVTIADDINGSVLPGQSQYPSLWDYSDGVDTMEYLSNLT